MITVSNIWIKIKRDGGAKQKIEFARNLRRRWNSGNKWVRKLQDDIILTVHYCNILPVDSNKYLKNYTQKYFPIKFFYSSNRTHVGRVNKSTRQKIKKEWKENETSTHSRGYPGSGKRGLAPRDQYGALDQDDFSHFFPVFRYFRAHEGQNRRKITGMMIYKQ